MEMEFLTTEHLKHIREVLDMELIRCGLELIEHNPIDFTEHFNHGNGKIVVLDTRENNFRDLVTPEILALIRACGGEPQITIMAPVPYIRCDDHIYREEREFKKQKKEKFKSPMWNF